jgi:hypothetical protein
MISCTCGVASAVTGPNPITNARSDIGVLMDTLQRG